MADTMNSWHGSEQAGSFLRLQLYRYCGKSKNYTSYQSGCYERTRQTVDRRRADGRHV